MEFFDQRTKLSLARSFISKSSPVYVQYYITARCNMWCEQCNIIYANGDSSEMNIHQIRKTAENLAEIGVCIVLLIGGEPFVRKDLPEIIKAFVDNGIHVRMQTNGLANEREIVKCIEAGGHDISISLDSLNEGLQDTINGGIPKSWWRAMRAISIINNLFPENGKAFFGTVLMPRNLEHVRDVLEFSNEIGWGVSLVPCHTTDAKRPLGFRTFDDTKVCTFTKEAYPRVKHVLEELKDMRRQGYNLYDSDEYMDDIYRFIAHEPLQWRRRNGNVCDSPYLYFAVEPNGNIQPCCDYKLDRSFPVFHDDFPSKFRGREIHKEVAKFTHQCDGCMYGSYPEMTLSTRFLKPMLDRFFLFNSESSYKLKKLSEPQLIELSRSIFEKNRKRREEKESELSHAQLCRVKE